MSGIPPNNSEGGEGNEVTNIDSRQATKRPISQISSAAGGFKNENNLVRSVLMHPMCFTLLIYLNNVDIKDEHPEYVWSALKDFVLDDPTNMRENVFAVAACDWEGGETDFTQNLLSNINLFKIGMTHFTTTSEKRISGESEEQTGKAGTGQVDFIFHKQEQDEDKRSSVVALFEFGIDNAIWWQKQDQILQYVEMLRFNKDRKYKIDQPILLSVVTFNEKGEHEKGERRGKKKGTMTDQQHQNKFNETLQTYIDTENNPDIQKNTFEARFGVYLCIPKNDNKFYITMLWRHETITLEDASTQFGKFFTRYNCVHIYANIVM